MRFPYALVTAALLCSSDPTAAALIQLPEGVVVDSSSRLMWIQDASLATTQSFGASGIGSGGQMPWSTASAWIAAMNSARHLGHSDWRLPSSLNANGSGPCFGFSCFDSEMGRLHFAEGVSRVAPAPFTRISNLEYWTATRTSPEMAWSFSFATSLQSQNFLTSTTFMALPVRNLTLADVLKDSVAVTTSGPTISAQFQPRFGVTLAEAAAMGGFDHFNWINHVTYDPSPPLPNLRAPYIDPPPGGGIAFGGPADSLPFYWDEQAPSSVGYMLGDHQFDITGSLAAASSAIRLEFLDTPGDLYLQSNLTEFIGFSTYLAGVRGNGTWSPVSHFTWRTNFWGANVHRSIAPPTDPSAGGGIFNVTLDADLADIPASELALITANGGILIAIPEPNSAWMLCIGLLIILRAMWVTMPSRGLGAFKALRTNCDA